MHDATIEKNIFKDAVDEMGVKFLEPVRETNGFLTRQPKDRMSFGATM